MHRVIKALLAAKRYHLSIATLDETAAVKRAGKPAKPHHEEQERWEAAGAHCSANERRADEASRDVEAWLKCRYMREHLGEEFGGTVSAVTSFGLFVTLDALYVDGLVHITELGGEYFRFDEARQELRGERTGIRYVVGTRVRVQVSRVDLDGRKIDFRLVREQDDARAPVRGKAHDELDEVARATTAACGRPTARRRRARRRGQLKAADAATWSDERKATGERALSAAAAPAARGTSASDRGSIAGSTMRRRAPIRRAHASPRSAPTRAAVDRAAAASAAAPWRHAEAKVGCHASRSADAAHAPPIQPASTSPVPALASAALPVGLMCGTRPGAAITLPEPLSTTTARELVGELLRGAQPIALHRRASRIPSSRAASSGCGVSTVCRPCAARARSRWRSGGSAATALSASASSSSAPACASTASSSAAHRVAAAAAADHRRGGQRVARHAPVERAQHQLGPRRVEQRRTRIERADEDAAGAGRSCGAAGEQRRAAHARARRR